MRLDWSQPGTTRDVVVYDHARGRELFDIKWADDETGEYEELLRVDGCFYAVDEHGSIVGPDYFEEFNREGKPTRDLRIATAVRRGQLEFVFIKLGNDPPKLPAT